MTTTEQGGLRCHDADACAMGQKSCPTPAACGCAPTGGLMQIAEPAQQPDAHAAAAIATLHTLGYTWLGGELWKPPTGRAPDFNLLDAKNDRIEELEEMLRKECQHSAEQKLRADRMSQQHSTQAALNSEARKELAEMKAPQCLHQIAEPAANLTSELADMLERSITGLGHYRNTDRWSEADEEHINECNALLERFNSSDDEHEAAPQAVQPAVPRGTKFFSFDPCDDLVVHGTEDAARAAAQQSIDIYREDAADGWPEEVERVCWGMVLGQAAETKLSEDLPSGAFAMGVSGSLPAVDFELQSPAHPAEGVPAPMTHAEAAAALAINSALHRIREGNAADAIEPLEQARAALAATQPAAQGLGADGMYYLQDARWSSMVGNCPSFWRPDANGYTTNLDEAERFTFEDAMKQHQCRETDLPWLCSEVDKLRRPTVDFQYMPRSWEAQRAALAAQAKQGEQANG